MQHDSYRCICYKFTIQFQIKIINITQIVGFYMWFLSVVSDEHVRHSKVLRY